MKVSIKGFITCKKAEQYIDCADNYAVNKSSHKFSVSDGVSKSFFPKIWSEILVSQFVEQTDLEDSELIKVCQKEWRKTIDDIVSSPDTKWFTKSQYNRNDPALATFVGLQFFEKEKKWSASALGDSFLFFVPNDYKNFQKELLKLSSKAEPIVFDNFPDYLTSIGDSHKGRRKERSGNLRNGTFYLMTDALAEWFISEGELAVGKIAVWQSQQDFQRFVNQAIDEDQLTNDDCAILCIELSDVDGKGIEYEKIRVTDLKELISDQEAEKEKVEQEKLIEEKEKEGEKLKAVTNQPSIAESSEQELRNEPNEEGFISKVKGFFWGKGKEEEKEKDEEIISSEKALIPDEETKDSKSEEKEQINEEPIRTDATESEDEKIEKNKIEEEPKENGEKKATENSVPSEQPKVTSKTKNILDKF